MRVTTGMQQASMLNMQNSEAYKKYAAVEQEDTTKPKSKKNEIQIDENTILEMSGDKLTLSRLGEDDTKTVLDELYTNTKEGQKLAELFVEKKSDPVSDIATQIKQIKGSMNLANYL